MGGVESCVDKHEFTGIWHFGMMECRTVLSGSLVIFGVPFNSVPGVSTRDKRAFLLLSADSSFFMEVFTRGSGFIAKVVPDEVFVIPSGYFFVSCSQGKPLRYVGRLSATSRTRTVW